MLIHNWANADDTSPQKVRGTQNKGIGTTLGKHALQNGALSAKGSVGKPRRTGGSPGNPNRRGIATEIRIRHPSIQKPQWK
jgi:hypothetical protein